MDGSGTGWIVASIRLVLSLLRLSYCLALLLAGGAEPTNQQVEVLLSSALETCEMYFQAFQFVVWSGMDAKTAIDSVMFETVGEA